MKGVQEQFIMIQGAHFKNFYNVIEVSIFTIEIIRIFKL